MSDKALEVIAEDFYLACSRARSKDGEVCGDFDGDFDFLCDEAKEHYRTVARHHLFRMPPKNVVV
jgi:hypothetical protein